MRQPEPPIVFTHHARQKMAKRGVSEDDVLTVVRLGRREPARRGLWQYRMNFEFNKEWGKTYYGMRQVMPIVAEEEERLVIVTVYAFYFQEGQER